MEGSCRTLTLTCYVSQEISVQSLELAAIFSNSLSICYSKHPHPGPGEEWWAVQVQEELAGMQLRDADF